MWRHKKERIISQNIECLSFEPNSKKKKSCKEILIMLDEIQAIWLADVQWLHMKEAAKKMWVSAPTFCRILAKARKKIWTAVLDWCMFTICSWTINFDQIKK